MDYYMADTPGRLRIESSALKGDPSKEKRFRDLVMAIPGVQSVDLRPEIGSVTIHYDPHATDHEALIGEVDRSGYFDHLKAKTLDQCLEEDLEKVGEVLVGALKDGLL
jgi:hypothetical protein